MNAKGEHSLFFQSDEVHIRALALDPKGNLIAGSDGSGLVYRIAPNGEAFVLYSAPKKEITALAIDPAGNIYAASCGRKARRIRAPNEHHAGAPGADSTAAGWQHQHYRGSNPAPAALSRSGTRRHWRLRDLSHRARRRTRRGCGLRMRISSTPSASISAGACSPAPEIADTFSPSTESEDDFTDLIKASATQITAFAAAPGGGLYASSSNLGKIFVLGAGPEAEGSYESDVFDAHIFSLWGRATMRSVGNVELYARSGNVDNPDRNWSPWTRVDLASTASGELNIPPARFVQWKTVLHAGTPAPRVDDVLLNYLPKNVAPEVDEITVQPGYHYQPIPHVTGGFGESRSAAFRSAASCDSRPRFDRHSLAGARRQRRSARLHRLLSRRQRIALAAAEMEPDRSLLFVRLQSSARRRLHRKGHRLRRTVAFTGRSALRGARQRRFEVDTTAPVIENLTAVLDSKPGEKRQIHVRFRASDSFSPIKRAEYSLDGGDWQFVEPVGQLSDAKTEAYDFAVRLPLAEAAPPPMSQTTGNDHVIVVRAYDRFDNQATAKTVIRGK